jgi:acyl-CoA thioesterase-2
MPEANLADLVAVAQNSQHQYLGWCLRGARGRIFGGQVAAQALYAAGRSAVRDRPPQSLHVHFLRPGDPARPVTYTVLPLKEGRAFSVCQVHASQDEQIVLTATASFHAPEKSPDYQVAPAATPEPARCELDPRSPAGSNPEIRNPLEFRRVVLDAESDPPAPPEQEVWLRARRPLPDDELVHACALVYATDTTLPRTARRPIRRPGLKLLGSSLDHTVWFHRAFRADEWLLFVQRTSSYAHGRTLSQGQVFTGDGRLAASAAQEALLREG